MNARRTVVRLTFAGVDISADINKHLLSLTYTDNEEDKTDDLQLSLDDREGVWLGKWLNTPGASKGVEISAVIVQKNWESNGKDRVLDCGVFEIDTVDGSGPPAKATIKAGSIPYKSTVRTQKKTKAWENYTLSGIAKEIAGKNGLTCMFESAFDPLYTRKEQIQESDITFLQRLCKAAGISLKVTAKIIVLFDAAAYEQKDAVRVIKRGTADVSSWSFSTSLHDASYSKCHVSYLCRNRRGRRTLQSDRTRPNRTYGAVPDGQGGRKGSPVPRRRRTLPYVYRGGIHRAYTGRDRPRLLSPHLLQPPERVD